MHASETNVKQQYNYASFSKKKKTTHMHAKHISREKTC